MDEFDEQFPWDMPGPNEHEQARYADAYGDYTGGYGPGGGFAPRAYGALQPPPFMGPPYSGGTFIGPMRGRGFGPKAPPKKNPAVNVNIKHLLSCGLTKESLKNLPNDLLMKIEPNYCGLCDVSCDTFVLSRMHYLSKNHSKNVRKMVSKGPSGSSNEAPLKSRELYCELCDVEITSKEHGDAHYAGKLHRGVVEGRKKSRNPLLLQPNMHARLEQLIRREKRSLKSLPANDNAVKEVKPAPPELYCDICKTTMTCSEQMTIHMNGRRHLAKEKNHIFKMMRGPEVKIEANAEDDEENGEDNGVDGGEGQGGLEDWGEEAWDVKQEAQATTA